MKCKRLRLIGWFPEQYLRLFCLLFPFALWERVCYIVIVFFCCRDVCFNAQKDSFYLKESSYPARFFFLFCSQGAEPPFLIASWFRISLVRRNIRVKEWMEEIWVTNSAHEASFKFWRVDSSSSTLPQAAWMRKWIKHEAPSIKLKRLVDAARLFNKGGEKSALGSIFGKEACVMQRKTRNKHIYHSSYIRVSLIFSMRIFSWWSCRV